jgi:demethylmenaquinone methyltransferase/2-methoxy-6-polyprenyl-1,4-benzoquinol methylase
MSCGQQAPAAENEPFTASLERMNLFQEPEARAIIADLGLPQGSRGLDVGCGVGLFALWLAESIGAPGCVVGVEPTEERAKAARELVGGRLDGRLEFRQGDGTALAMEDGSFDWLWCGDVLHHIVETDAALREFRRVVRPGGRVIVKESQVLSAMFLPGHPELERRIQLAELERTRDEGAGRSFLERRQRTRESLRAAGLEDLSARTYLLERRAPLTAADTAYIQKTVFDRNWGQRLRPLLSADDWVLRTALCDGASPQNVLRSADYYCLYPITVFAARVPQPATPPGRSLQA